MKKDIKINKGVVQIIIILTVLSALVFRDFLTIKKLYVFNDAGGDTLISYWPHYVNIFSKIQSGSFSWWNFNNGIGNTVITRMNELFDPFNSFFYFIPINNIIYSLGYIATLKVILSGLFFYFFLGRFKHKHYTRVIVSILYAFNGYIILWGQHYLFATVMVYVPLLLYFYEIWFQEKKYIGFIFMIFLISVLNFYFLYITSILLFIYAIMRYIEENNFNFRQFFRYFLKTIIIYILGVMLSSFITIPYLTVLMSSPRIGGYGKEVIFSLRSIETYIILVQRLFSNASVIQGQLSFDDWWNYYESPILYCGVISLLLLPQMLRIKNNKKKKTYKFFTVIMIIFLIFPIFSLVMNGFSATYFRWTYVIITLNLYFIANIIDEVILEGNLDFKLILYTYLILCLVPISTLLWGYYSQSITWEIENIYNTLKVLGISIVFMTLYVIFLSLIEKNRFKEYVLISIGILVCIEVGIFANHDINKRLLLEPDYLNNYGYYDNSKEAIEYIKSLDNTFYRIDKSFISQSYADSYIQNFYGFKAYDSLSKFEYIDLMKTLQVEENNNFFPNFISGVYNRPKLQNLLGTKYIITKSDEEAPPNYEFMRNFKDVNIYINKNHIPLGFTYEKTITREKFEEINPYLMDDILYMAAVIDQNSLYSKFDNIALEDSKFENYFIPVYPLEYGESNIVIKEQINNTNLIYKVINHDPNLIISLSEFSQQNYSAIEIEFDANIQKSQDLQLFWETNTLGFSEDNSIWEKVDAGDNRIKLSINNLSDEIKKIRLDLGTKDEIIKLENIKFNLIKKTELKDLSEYSNDLKRDNFKIDSFKEDYIKANIKVDKDKLLCFSIPYDKGWKVKVNGVDTKTEKVNIGLLSVEIKQGYNDVELTYKPPRFKLGLIITLLTFSILIINEIIKKNKFKL